MTISSDIRTAGPFTGTGAVSVYAFSFKVFATSEVVATSTNTSGVLTTLTQPTDYTVTLNSNQNTSPGGTITLAAPLASGYQLEIGSEIAATQGASLPNQGGWFPAVIEDALDRLTILAQQMGGGASHRTLRVPELGGIDDLPPILDRADSFLRFDTSGNPQAYAGTPTDSTSLAADLASTATGKGAQLVGVPGSTDTAGAKLQRFRLVTDYGTVGDGATSDQAAVAAAVAAALAAGDDLWWPDGTYLTTANIPSLHSVRHFGPGIIKRGSNLYYVQPTEGQTNTLHVAATGGSTTNDGLSASEPFSTILGAGNTLYSQMYSDAKWVIQLAAGTYAMASSFLRPFPSSQRVEFTGPVVALGATPTAIIDYPGSGVAAGLFFQNNCFVKVSHIKFTDWLPTNCSGLTGDACSNIWCYNVHASNCYNGLEISQSSFMRVQGGILDGNQTAFSATARAGYTLGSGATAATADGSNGPAIINSVLVGVFCQEGATGHADYCYLDNNAVNFDFIERSRAHIMGCTINGTSSQTGVRAKSGSSWYDNPTVPNTWSASIGTRTVVGAFSVDTANENYTAARPEFIAARETATQATSSLVAVSAYTKTISAYELVTRGAGFELELLCSVTGVAGTKNVTVTFAGVTLLNRTVAAASTAYVIKVKFITRDGIPANSQKVVTEVYENGATPVIAVNAALTIDLKVDQVLSVTHNVANAADTNRIQHTQLNLIR